jgi:two-component system sensor histidine kinase DesK
MVAAMAVLPLLYVIPAVRPWWFRHRCLLLVVQAALTCLPFVLFGPGWLPGPSGWLAGLILLTASSPGSWLACAGLAVADVIVRIGINGLPVGSAAPASAASGAVAWTLFAFVIDALALFGLARMADLVAAVHAARNELAEAAVTAERLRVTDTLRATIGDPLAFAARRTAAAKAELAVNQSLAREYLAETAAAARQALAEVRAVTSRYRDAVPEIVTAIRASGTTLAPRLAQTVLVVMLCGFAVQDVFDVAENSNGSPDGTFSAAVIGWTIANAVALTVLQLRHSWPSPGSARPRGWVATLALQLVLTYAMVPVTGWRPLAACGLLAGSALLLLPAPLGRAAFVAVIASVPVLWLFKPELGLTRAQSLEGAVFLTLTDAAVGLLVYGLTRLAWLAARLEELRAELAHKAVLGERLRVARDTHDLLGFGLSAIAMKADLIGRLIDRGDARVDSEMAELARICAAARADMRRLTSEADDLPPAAQLDVEVDAARDVLTTAGIDLRASVAAVPEACAPQAGTVAAVLVPVIREAVTNILKHSSATYCVLEMTADAGRLRLLISNDGGEGADHAPLAAAGHAGTGLGNIATRIEAAGGRLTVQRGGEFSLTAEIPLAQDADTDIARAPAL